MPGPVQGNLATINTPPDEGFVDMPSTPIAYNTYDLEPVMGRAIQLQINDESYPEYEAYHFEVKAPVKTAEKSYLDRARDASPISLEDVNFVAKGLASVARRFFYETDFDILLSLADGHQVRATKNPIVGSEGLYSLSTFAPKVWFTNFFKRSCLEGFWTGRWEVESGVKVAERTPRILLNKAKEIFTEFDQEIVSLARKSAAILSDDQFDNQKYLTKMVGDLTAQISEYKMRAIQLELSNRGAGSTALKKVKEGVDKLLDKSCSSVSSFSPRVYYKVDELKVFIDEFFNQVDQFSESIRASYNKMLLESNKRVEEHPVDHLRAQVYQLTCELYAMSKKSAQQIAELSILVDDFEKRRA